MIGRRLNRVQRWGAFTLLALIPLLITALVTSVIGGAAERTDKIPALVVNNDQMVTTTNADGSSSPVLAGRLIVTALTGADSPGFAWSLANDESADAELRAGRAYAVVTIPKDFSKSIATLGTGNPVQAKITMTTDDAHSYLAGSLAQSLGTAMTSAIGQQITEQVLAGLFGQLGSLSGGTQGIADGTADLHNGLVTFSAGLRSASDGATQAAAGVQQYVSGVNGYTAGVDTLANNLNEGSGRVNTLAQGLAAYCPDPAQTLTGCPVAQAMSVGQLSDLVAGLQGVTVGTAQLSANSEMLRSSGAQAAYGVTDLASGLAQLSNGASQTATGAGSLADGAQQLATGLSQGGSGTSAGPTDRATVISQPVTLTQTVLNKIDSVRDLIALLIVPAALWLGALAIIAVRRPFSDQGLQSTDGSLRVVARTLGRSLNFGVIQLVLALTAALIVGVNGVSVLAAGALAAAATFSFIALNVMFKLIWPRAASVLSLVFLIVQIVVLPGVLPTEMLPTWMQAAAGAFPLTWAMNGMQAIGAGTGYATAVSAGISLILLGVAASAVTTLLLSSRRLNGGLGFVVASAA